MGCLVLTDSIFTRIIKGELPCYKIYEDDLTFAFLNIHPTQAGHTLVVPKKQIDQLWDVPDEDYQALMATCKKVARHLRQLLGVKRVGVRVVGEEVPHTHIHLIPFNEGEEYFAHVPDGQAPDHAALAAIAAKLAF